MIPSLFIPILLFISTSAQRTDIKRYRSDYVYNGKTKAYYKLHIETEPVWRAKNKCQLEGGELMVVASKQDIIQAHAMFKAYPDIGDILLIGAPGQTQMVVEETTMEIDLHIGDSHEERRPSWLAGNVMNRQGEVMLSHYVISIPFICKVEAIDAYYDSHCKVYGRDYTYVPDVGSCYKIPRVATNWNAAFAECDAEGAHLVVVNSEAEHQTIRHMIITAPAIDHATKNYFFYAGFRANRPRNGTERVFKTIFNQTLDEAGFNVWSENEPNNAGDSEYCGCIFKNNGLFNDIDCVDSIGFICEKEIGVNVSS